MAVALARSFSLWHRNSDISFWIATDNISAFPKDIKLWVNFIELTEGQLGEGFSSKLHLDKIAPTKKTLFIDSDCLIVRNLDFIFTLFEGKPVSVVGNYISDGEWFGNIKSICKKYDLDKLPKFNGGIYYVEKGELANKVYEKARELEHQYDEIGFVRLRNKPNDEVIMAVAMALNHQQPLIDDGTIMSDPQACQGNLKLNVYEGKSELINPPFPSKLHQNWYPFLKVSPAIVHFLGYYTTKYPYIKEENKLKFFFEKNVPIHLVNIITFITITIPYKMYDNLKILFRPTFHLLFGVRSIKQSKRI